MPKVILYCDESGAKGYADQDEAYPGEVGVFAGIMVPDELLATTRIEFDRIAAHYATEAGKLHIADLVPSVLSGCINPGLVYNRTYTLDQISQAYDDMDNRRVIKPLIHVA